MIDACFTKAANGLSLQWFRYPKFATIPMHPAQVGAFVVRTGLLLLSSVTQSLAGRAALLELLPLCAVELRRGRWLGTNLFEVMLRGGYPAPHQRAERCDVYYYRDQRAREVDFVLDSGGTLTFVEAKWTEHPTSEDARSIAALDSEPRASKLRVRPGRHAIVCRTPNAYPITGRTMALPHTQLRELLAPAPA